MILKRGPWKLLSLGIEKEKYWEKWTESKGLVIQHHADQYMLCGSPRKESGKKERQKGREGGLSRENVWRNNGWNLS